MEEEVKKVFKEFCDRMRGEYKENILPAIGGLSCKVDDTEMAIVPLSSRIYNIYLNRKVPNQPSIFLMFEKLEDLNIKTSDNKIEIFGKEIDKVIGISVEISEERKVKHITAGIREKRY